MKDTFAKDHLPKNDLQPKYSFLDLPQFNQPENLNCVEQLLDMHCKQGNGNRPCIYSNDILWTYDDLLAKANQIAHVLVDDLHVKPDSRVLLRSCNNALMVACWFAVLKVGGIVVATMPLLRAKELETMIECAEIAHVISDYSLAEEVHLIASAFVKSTSFFGEALFDALIASKPTTFQNHPTKANDIALIGFTSGTTGNPKMTAHYHKDILNICEAFPAFSLQPTPKDVFTGTPPIGFTFGLGGLVLFPMYYGASTVLIEKPNPDILLQTIEKYEVTVCFTAPTAWRILTEKSKDYNISSLRKCVSAGETLPLKIWEDWYATTGLKIIDGIGATEMLHIFISSNAENIRPGATGVAVTGYEAKVVDNKGNEVDRNTPGRLAVRGITGCKYLNRPEKQREYVENGWNITGDVFKQDEDGFFWFVARGDDMIISSGYNIAAIEVESVLLQHNDIAECAVVGIPDAERGMLVCAHIVLKNHEKASKEFATELQNWFKEKAAPYKYPRMINFMERLPKTETGKIQRFKLK
ncbi:AMP-binding protein [Flavobacterium sp. xlx-214]|uniref:AMP-binding protein n=1 Tax=unclassified Flavobacterium TaxID=196869 RepID=UPI0013D85DC2|nr:MULTISPECIES: AMP-binding protein [unclassified Flavobacterium]MBA5793787.1 AMP-binding protein [Flavobacterium sp. xlx-221]QMI83193.1 AMP-binding protein [Flavobacterium sp. xlx-214]